jgi:hypothetical protein
VYSKHLWVVPLKDKRNESVLEALHPLLSKYQPRLLQSDNGPEFNNVVPEGMRCKHILTPAYTPQVNGVVERVNGTIKRMIFQYLTNNSSRDYLSVLPSLVRNYNNSVHNKSKMSPNQIFNGGARYEMKTKIQVRKFPLMQRGDKCRISMALNPAWKKNMFVKRYYLPRWTKELYTISTVSPGRNTPTTYSLREVPGKRFKAQDLLHVDEDRLVRVQKPMFDKPAKQTEEERREAPDIRPNKVPRSVVVGPNTAVGASGRARRANAGVNSQLRGFFL